MHFPLHLHYEFPSICIFYAYINARIFPEWREPVYLPVAVALDFGNLLSCGSTRLSSFLRTVLFRGSASTALNPASLSRLANFGNLAFVIILFFFFILMIKFLQSNGKNQCENSKQNLRFARKCCDFRKYPGKILKIFVARAENSE